MVNAVKFYDLFDRIGCISFKVFTVYLRSRIHAGLYVKFDVVTGRKFTVYFQGTPRPAVKLSWVRAAALPCPGYQGIYNACVKFRFRYRPHAGRSWRKRPALIEAMIPRKSRTIL
jgi:hypothetical protein